MFIGHFAAGLASKKADNSISLGWAFFAAQWLDLLWPVLLLTGTEKVELRSDPHSPIPLSFTHYPVSHSLLAVTGWAVLIALIYYLIKKKGRAAIIIGLLVLSHWLLDLLVHIPDLPISPYSDSRFGLGLWNQPYLALIIELTLFAGGLFLYISSTKPVAGKSQWVLWSLAGFLLVIHLMNVLGPPPNTIEPIAWVGLSQWLLVFWADRADKKRVARQ